MLDRNTKIKRVTVGQQSRSVMDLPDLVDIQIKSFEKFLQREHLKAGNPVKLQGLEEVFQTVFPIESQNGDMRLEYSHYILDEDNIKLTQAECKQKGHTYAIPVKARINLVFLETGEIRQKDIYMGDVPLMTSRGTFIINGAERVVVSQIHRSPGVIFSHEKGIYSSGSFPTGAAGSSLRSTRRRNSSTPRLTARSAFSERCSSGPSGTGRGRRSLISSTASRP
jgi:DNA-directed RNA polymerase subunit beta